MPATGPLLITLFFGRMAGLIPLATLGAIMLCLAYRMADWWVLKSELSAPKSDAIAMVAMFLLTVLVDLTTGIGVGMVLASFLFMKRMAEVTVHAQPLVALERSGMLDEIGEENLFGNVDEALAAAEAVIAKLA